MNAKEEPDSRRSTSSSSIELDQVLATKHAHPRDARVRFFDATHHYEVDGSKYDISVTGVWSQYFDHFDADASIQKNLDKWRRNPRGKYFELIKYLDFARDETRTRRAHAQLPESKTTDARVADPKRNEQLLRYLDLVRGCSDDHALDEALRAFEAYDGPQVEHDHDHVAAAIKKMWEAYGNKQADLGTAMHREFEFYMNRLERDGHDDALQELSDGPESDQFRKWLVAWPQARGWKPYRTEWSIFCETVRVAGQIDSVWRRPDGKLVIVDWKRCKGLLGPGQMHWDRFGKGPCRNIPNTSFGHYTIQQNMYAYMLRVDYGIEVETIYLGQMHRNHKTFNMVEVPRRENVIQQIFYERLEKIGSGEEK